MFTTGKLSHWERASLYDGKLFYLSDPKGANDDYLNHSVGRKVLILNFKLFAVMVMTFLLAGALAGIILMGASGA